MSVWPLIMALLCEKCAILEKTKNTTTLFSCVTLKRMALLLSLQGPDGKEGFDGAHGLPVSCLILLHIYGTLFITILLKNTCLTAFLSLCYYSVQGDPGLQGPVGPPGATGCNGTDVRKHYSCFSMSSI